MKKRIFHTALVFTLSLCMAFSVIIISGGKEVAASYIRYVTASSLCIRKSASGSAAVVGYYYKGNKVTCYGTSGNWTKVKYNGYY